VSEAPVTPNAPYAGYFKTATPPENAELTHVGPGTPCGEYLRRFWQPVAMASELTDVPVPVRILGEDLVVFRDHGGRVGILHRHCSHRGASLEYGIIMERGISCCYHGWRYDVDGTILDTPGEPPDSPLRHRLTHGAYPALEYRGLVFAYLGPPDGKPEFPVYDVFELPDTDWVPFSLVTPCNWLQVIENTQDPVHTVFLHTRASGAQFGEAWGELQILDYYETPIGMFNCQTRRWRDHVWVRTTETILPNANQTGALWEQAHEEKFFMRVSLFRWMVPIDDTNTVTIGWRFFNDVLDPEGKGDRGRVGKGTIDFVGQYEDRPYEERQKQPGDYEVQVSQRPIAVHALETLGSTDRGVAMWRRLVRHGIRAVGVGQPVASPRRPVPTYTQDTIVRLPPRPEGDREFLQGWGRKVAGELLASAGLSHDQRAGRLQGLR
jgi:nitrite reductase/ring-hydroxylating ferredoxin subunit